jgi:16S rRNA (adenine1518-N6/adenine1519-N6)-dimethyltransferase
MHNRQDKNPAFLLEGGLYGLDSLTSPRVVKSILNRHGFRFTKSLGQNFLIDDNILKKIVGAANINSQDLVLEIGPGIGTLTRELAARARKVATVEIDKRLLSILEETLADFSNVTVIHGDILKINLTQLVHNLFDDLSFKVVANLPYYITTPIIMGILERGVPFESITVLVQREVAERMVASPGNKDYGALSVAVQYYTVPRVVGKVPASVFIPPPKVDSMIITLEKRSEPSVHVEDRRLFFEIVHAAFAKRRKTLINNLMSAGGELKGWTRQEIEEVLNQCGIDPQRRGETLSFEEFAFIANRILSKKKSKI